MTSGNQVGIGIWGAGWVAGAHAEAYESTPGCEIVAIGSRRRESAVNLAGARGLDCRIYTDYADFLSDPDLDAVSICTPNGLHAPNAVDGAQAGKHLFIEKPVALKPEDLARMREAVSAAGIVTSVGFVSRGNPLVRRMHEIVQSGALGEIYMIDADYWHSRLGRPDYYKTAEEAGNAYMVGGVHAVDAVRFITGLDITAVCAASTQIGSAAAEGYEMHAADALLVKYSNGAVGRVSAAIHGHMPYQVNLDILGDRGVIRNDRVFTQRKRGRRSVHGPGGAGSRQRQRGRSRLSLSDARVRGVHIHGQPDARQPGECGKYSRSWIRGGHFKAAGRMGDPSAVLISPAGR